MKPLNRGKFANLASPDLVAKHQQLTHVEQLKNEYQIVVKDSGTLTEQVRIGVQQGQRIWYVNNFQSKKLLIEQGLGWGTLPRQLVEQQLAEKKLVELHLNGFPIIEEITYYLVKMKHRILGPIASEFWQKS